MQLTRATERSCRISRPLNVKTEKRKWCSQGGGNENTSKKKKYWLLPAVEICLTRRPLGTWNSRHSVFLNRTTYFTSFYFHKAFSGVAATGVWAETHGLTSLWKITQDIHRLSCSTVQVRSCDVTVKEGKKLQPKALLPQQTQNIYNHRTQFKQQLQCSWTPVSAKMNFFKLKHLKISNKQVSCNDA